MSYHFTVQCPKCHKKMQYHTYQHTLEKKRKVCVYCGRSFVVKKYLA